MGTSRNNVRAVRLLADQIAYLTTGDVLPRQLSDELARLWPAHTHDLAQSRVLLVESEIVEAIDDALSDRLARMGFDASYALTPEGEIIDAIIVRLGPPPPGE